MTPIAGQTFSLFRKGFPMQTGVSNITRAALAIAFGDILKDTVAGAKIKLFQNNFAPGPTAKLADFTECDFVGYAEVLITATWHVSSVPETGQVRIYSTASAAFVASSIVSPQTAYGFFCTDSGDGVLQGWGLFDNPVDFIVSGDALVVVPEWLMQLNTLVAEVGHVT